MKLISALLFISLVAACNSTEVKEDHTSDSMDIVSDKKVDTLLMNDDSLIKAKEKELLEKYK